jgi:hypothetical protein
MTTIFDLINPPRKKPDDYVEFISLFSDYELFDDTNPDVMFSRFELGRCEALYRTRDDRWILVYAPFPGDIPPWVNVEDIPEGLLPSEAPMPPNRELAPTEVTQWLLMNQHVIPHNFRPVLKAASLSPSAAPSRLHHEWRLAPDPIVLAKTSTPTPADTIGDTESAASSVGSDNPGKKLKAPSIVAMMVYRLSFLKGQKQKTIAIELSKELGRPICQGMVSKHLKRVTQWIKEGNVLPDLLVVAKKPTSIDPTKLNLGRRMDGRSAHRRTNSTD